MDIDVTGRMAARDFTGPAGRRNDTASGLSTTGSCLLEVDSDRFCPELEPGDDFFEYVNGKWIEANPIPAELTTISNFTMLVERNRASLRTLIEDLAASDPTQGSDEKRLVDAYRAFLDAGTLASATPERARPWLERIQGAASLEQLAVVTAEPGLVPLLSVGVTADPRDPQAYAVSLGPAALGLPGRDYYLGEDERSRTIRSAYRAYLSLLLSEAGHRDHATMAGQVIEFERTIAGLHWTRELLRNPDLAWTPISPADLAALAPAFPLATLLQASGFGSVDRLIARQLAPEATAAHAGHESQEGSGLPAVVRLLAETPLAVLKAHCTAQFLNLHAEVLGSTIDDARYALYDRLIRGRAEPLARWKRALAAVEAQLGELLGARYVARHFPPESKTQLEALVGNVLAAMRESIAGCRWMGEETKGQALAKLAAFDIQIGHGARSETYEGLAIAPDDPLANEMAAARWKHHKALLRLGRRVDRSEWPFLPQTVNASYREERNQIIFPAGILQPPFFDPAADAAVNYGAIGAIIGHEIGHGFDDQGAKYDGAGALRNWWQLEDRAQFDALTEGLVAQYEAYRPLAHDEAVRINGRLSLGENIADLAGLELAYRAYRLSLGGTEAPVIGGFTGEQRFFLAFAQLWRGAQREPALRNHLATAPHSPARFRVNGTVRNMDAWYEAFGITRDMGLYLPPDERVRIWST